MTESTDNDKFVPTFAMPVIAPPPEGYVGGAIAYYAAVALQSFLAFEDVVVPPEAALLPDPQQTTPLPPPDAKGLRIAIPNPSGSITGSAPFGTLFALMGGWLTYLRAVPNTIAGSAVDLAPILLPPFDAVTPAPQYAAPAGLDPTKRWGALILRLWGMDFQKLAEAMGQSPACNAVYYLGVDEESARAALKPLVKLHFLEEHFNQPTPDGAKPAFQDVVEEIKGQLYAATPAYPTLVDDFLTELMNGNTSLLVKGGAPIGQAVQVTDNTSTTSSPSIVGRIELWFMDNSEPQQFIASTQIFKGAPTYDF